MEAFIVAMVVKFFKKLFFGYLMNFYKINVKITWVDKKHEFKTRKDVKMQTLKRYDFITR